MLSDSKFTEQMVDTHFIFTPNQIILWKLSNKVDLVLIQPFRFIFVAILYVQVVETCAHKICLIFPTKNCYSCCLCIVENNERCNHWLYKCKARIFQLKSFHTWNIFEVVALIWSEYFTGSTPHTVKRRGAANGILVNVVAIL